MSYWSARAVSAALPWWPAGRRRRIQTSRNTKSIWQRHDTRGGCRCSAGATAAGDELDACGVLRADAVDFAGGRGPGSLGEDVPHLVVRVPV